MSNYQLQQLGKTVSQLSKAWFGENADPLQHVDQISQRSGINPQVIESALHTTGGESHASTSTATGSPHG